MSNTNIPSHCNDRSPNPYRWSPAKQRRLVKKIVKIRNRTVFVAAVVITAKISTDAARVGYVKVEDHNPQDVTV